MNDLLRPYLRKFVLVFFDDILIYSSFLQEHVTHLSTVLHTLPKNGLVAHLKKCTYAASTIEYFGHVISVEGVAADPTKIEVMKQWPMPTTIKQLRGFLAFSLTQLLKKDNFGWNDAA